MAVVCSAMTGCGVVRQDTDEATQWQWEQRSEAPRSSLRDQYGIAPSHPQLVGRHDEFDFSHPRVGDFVNRYQTDLRGFYGRALERSGRYVPRISPILKKEGLPAGLAYLPLVESGFQPHAASHARAVGLWQFIPGTGRRYGLRIDKYVDERRDPVKSTHAAARYLKDLYGMFGDWHLSLAAYNSGEGNISRILDSGRTGDFWEMSERGYLYRETENYVPGFLAALQIAAAPEAYGFVPPTPESVEYDIVHVSRPCPLSKVAELCGSSTQEIKELNPALHHGVIPPNGYSVRLPKGAKTSFRTAYANLTTSDWASIDRTMQPKPSNGGRSCLVKHGRKVCKATKGHQVKSKAGSKAKAKRSQSKGRTVEKGRNAPQKVLVVRRKTSTVVATRPERRSRTLD
jgi:hypothetical protein